MRTKSAEYYVWWTMTRRCHWPKAHNYARYGGRGIRVCDRWIGKGGYKNFIADMGPRPSCRHQIDRIDNDGDYCPENCRWATAKDQARNRRSSRTVNFCGQLMTMAEIAEKSAIPYGTFMYRINRAGWDVERAASTPITNSRKK